VICDKRPTHKSISPICSKSWKQISKIREKSEKISCKRKLGML
jgi:hypothetical protein